MNIKCWALCLIVLVFCSGCAGESKQVRKLTKPVDETAENIVKVRELKDESGETRAVVSPADERQLKITF
jgi:hypothetical protein